MKLITGALIGLLVLAGRAEAQTADEVRISVGAYQLVATGAEKPVGVWLATGALALDRTTVGLFSTVDCGGFSLTALPGAFESNATVGWRVEVTPTKVVDHAVTFRLRWTRTPAINVNLSAANEDVIVTLRPGESRPIDAVPVNQATAKTPDGGPCQKKSVSLRVKADFPEFDRRLVDADVWLVERLANGKEQSQLQSIRGLLHRELPFYFDSVPGGTSRLDVLGHLAVDLKPEGMKIEVQGVRARGDASQVGYQAAQWFGSTVEVKPGEIVEVALPRLNDGSTTFADRVFSLRIRARQIR
jgi:hypothetical protein